MNIESKQEKLNWKQKLKSECINILEQRISTARKAMEMAQESANSEEKSSAGDKHETARASSQLERDMNARQLEQAKRELDFVNKIDITNIHAQAATGSVVLTKEYLFYISLGLGPVTIDENKVIFVSPNAPVAALLIKKKSGDSFTFNGKTTVIIEVF